MEGKVWCCQFNANTLLGMAIAILQYSVGHNTAFIIITGKRGIVSQNGLLEDTSATSKHLSSAEGNRNGPYDKGLPWSI